MIEIKFNIFWKIQAMTTCIIHEYCALPQMISTDYRLDPATFRLQRMTKKGIYNN